MVTFACFAIAVSSLGGGAAGSRTRQPPFLSRAFVVPVAAARHAGSALYRLGKEGKARQGRGSTVGSTAGLGGHPAARLLGLGQLHDATAPRNAALRRSW